MRVILEDAHLLPLELINQVSAQEMEKITQFSHPVLTMKKKKKCSSQKPFSSKI